MAWAYCLLCHRYSDRASRLPVFKTDGGVLRRLIHERVVAVEEKAVRPPFAVEGVADCQQALERLTTDTARHETVAETASVAFLRLVVLAPAGVLRGWRW